MKNYLSTFLLCFCLSALSTSCVKQIDLSREEEEEETKIIEQPAYIYPFDKEVKNVTTEITIQMNDGSVDLNSITASIPYLKYNKSLLVLMTQDDCEHSAYCRTWAAINGRPISSSSVYGTTKKDLNYDAVQFTNNDLPPNVYSLNKTLGSTDGAGNEVRFMTTTTINPECSFMSFKSEVRKGYTKDYERFYMKSGLVWDNVKEMVNFGSGIGFHDVEATDVNNVSQILQHYGSSQNIILSKLSGRGCKFLAEPNGNKTYVTAAMQYAPIETMVAQGGDGCVKLYPFQENTDLCKTLLKRVFEDSPEPIKTLITSQMALPKENREAISLGVHATDNAWVQFLAWVNNNYGKDGSDVVWFPSQEEYFEYNYYRTHGTIQKTIIGNTLKLTISLPSKDYFFYPSVTINLKGLNKQHIKSISTDNAVTGLSYADYSEGAMINIDCRKNLVEHATNYVERYEKEKINKSFYKKDALYFVNQLKNSEIKTTLLNRLN